MPTANETLAQLIATLTRLEPLLIELKEREQKAKAEAERAAWLLRRHDWIWPVAH